MSNFKKPACVHCGGSVVTKNHRNGSIQFKCKDCEKYFTVKRSQLEIELSDEDFESINNVTEKDLENTHLDDDVKANLKFCPKCGSTKFKAKYIEIANKEVEQYKCDCGNKFITPIIGHEIDIVKESVRIAKSKQKLQDINRVERKLLRESARVDNVIEELNEKMISLLEQNNLKEFTIAHDTSFDAPVGIVQVSDTHFGEVVKQSSNKYNWDIATKRLKKLVAKARVIFDANGVSDVCLLFTGDLQNSDRRLDEALINSENRMETMFLAVNVLEEMILDLNSTYNVAVGSIVGNESRVKDEMMFSIVSDNYDYSIHKILEKIFVGCEGVTFIGGQWDEKVISVNGKNILMCHGHNLKPSGLDNHVQKMRGKYASEGILLDHIIFGHIHSACVSDTYSRSSSLVGDNAYSNKALNLSGRASQNIHLIFKDGIDSMKIDLHETDGVDGYSYNKEYENYRTVEDTTNNTTIFKVVI